MSTHKLRTLAVLMITLFSLALGALSVAPGSALAEDNGGDEISQEEACYLLQDAYNRASEYASDARAKGDQAGYEFWSNQAQEAYLDAEFDWGCDWAAPIRLPQGGRNWVLVSAGNLMVSGGATKVVVGPPASATTSVRAYHLWLASKNHKLACQNVKRLLNANRGRLDSATVTSTARFTHCAGPIAPSNGTLSPSRTATT